MVTQLARELGARVIGTRSAVHRQHTCDFGTRRRPSSYGWHEARARSARLS